MQKQVWLYQKRGRSVYLRDENMMHCVVVWKTKISGFIHLSYKFTLVILGIRWSADLTDSENIYSIKKESTYILWRRGSWNRCCCCSVTKLCLTLCDPMNCSTPGFPVLYYLLEFAQTHFHWLVMPSNHLILCHLLLLLPSIFPSISVFSNESAGGQSIGVSASTSVLPMNTQDWSLQCPSWISLQSKGLSRVFSNITVQKHQFFGAHLSL